MPSEQRTPTSEERDETLTLPLDPIVALKAMLAVKLDTPEPPKKPKPKRSR